MTTIIQALKQNEPIYRPVQIFTPLPWQVEPWKDTSSVLLLTGSAGGGKSRLAAEKIHGFCLRYPGATAVVLRKVRAIMANSTILFIKRMVIGKDPRVTHRPSEFRFEYSNGSILAYGGMRDEEQREHIRGIGQDGGVDIAWMEEATQFTEEDYNEILARMRSTAAPWRQLILTTNPDAPGHWINVRLILGGEASIYKSWAGLNIYNPADYEEVSLSKLTGVQYSRLVGGEWVAGSGRVMDTWKDQYNAKTGKDRGGNVTLDAAYVPNGGEVVWAVDDGYSGKMDEATKIFTGKSHPRAFLLCQLRPDGQVAVFDEHLAIHTLASPHISTVKELSEKKGYPLPAYAVHDRASASIAGALNEAGIETFFNQVPVEESLKELREWIAPDTNGYRRVIVHPRCFYTRYQMQTYSYSDNGAIIKEHDDSIDALRYLVWNEFLGMSGGVDIVTWSDIQV